MQYGELVRYANPISTSVPTSGSMTIPREAPAIGAITRTHHDSGLSSWSEGNFTLIRASLSGSTLSMTRPVTTPFIMLVPGSAQLICVMDANRVSWDPPFTVEVCASTCIVEAFIEIALEASRMKSLHFKLMVSLASTMMSLPA